MIKSSNFISILVAAFLICNAKDARAATTVVSEGVAAVTAKLGDHVYRKRAIENALQNIAINRGRALTSFTVVENGQLLIDQIQSTSRAGILSFTVVTEYKRNKQYYVKIEAIVDDQYSQSKKSDISDTCRETNYPAVDLSLKINIDQQQFPAWMALDAEWISNKVNNENFKPNLVFTSGNAIKNSNGNLYTLFENSDIAKQSKNVYQIYLNLNFDKVQKEAFFIKNQIIKLFVNSEVRRHGIQIENESQTFEFIVKKKFGVGIPIQSNKIIWEQEKQRVLETIFAIINKKLEQITCVSIRAKLKKNKNTYYIDYGSMDGINKEDLFVIDTDKAEKFYFRVQELKYNLTQLKLISDSNKIELKDGHTIKLVEEL